ncbi:MAG: TetR/AcrR family transcriptional regulator C-terminal domain-containing protein [Clostridia bacterium]|nr:TetR/AcrR family transcriptional regulator C-terminal domain-containing protein [Clostridia bacterium]
MAGQTKELIKTTFLRLLDEMPLSKITVRTIVEACGINRNSFYYHFQDIPSLLEEIVRDECNKIIADYPTIESFEDCVVAAVSFAKQNKRAVMHMYNSTNRDIYERYLWETCKYVVNTYFNTVFPESSISEADREIITGYYESLSFGIIAKWLENGMKGDIESAFHRLCELKRGQAEELISRAEQK